MAEDHLPEDPQERAALFRTLKEEIFSLAERREVLRDQMAAWHADGRATRFPFYAQLQSIETQISRLNERYQALLAQSGRAS